MQRQSHTADADPTIGLVEQLLADHPPATTPAQLFLEEQFDRGLAWVNNPPGLGGLGLAVTLQPAVDARLALAGAPDPFELNPIGHGMCGPTIAAWGTDSQRAMLRSLFSGEEVWCQLFSEPGAGSDLAGLATRARLDGDGWLVNGQKVWTTMAHQARYGLLIARTDSAAVKHAGLSAFIVDMHAPGVEVRPLVQMTGEAEFNEVFLTDVRLPSDALVGEMGGGWQVALTTLMNERVSIGGARIPREGGMIGKAATTWRERPELRTHDLHRRLLDLWVDAEVARLTGERLRQQLVAGQPGPEGSAMKLGFARLNQAISGLEVELLGEEGLLYGEWEMRRPDLVDFTGRDAGYRYLRSKGNSIEGGTTEVLLNIVAERVLGLPSEPRNDKDVAWKDLSR